MNIGLLDIDGHNFHNLALMKIAGWHKAQGDDVDLALPFERYDLLYRSKIFTFSPDDNTQYFANQTIGGGTGYDVKSRLPEEIDRWTRPDYTIYPQHRFSIQFYSRGCIRHCPFCLVHDKEGSIHPVEPMELNPAGEWIEVLDNNFFANPEWREACKDLKKAGQPIKFHGVDVRIMDEEQAWWLNNLKLKNGVHIAWDLPQIDLTERLQAMIKHIKPYKVTCYVLVGFNSTVEQDLFRLNTLKRLGIYPFVQPFRDYENKRTPTQYERDLARWANRAWFFKSTEFKDFSPRKGFKCEQYLK